MDKGMEDFYQDMILEHNKNPRNYGEIKDTVNKAYGYNSSCGDSLVIYLKIKDKKLVELKFQGDGCAISKASSSIMTDMLKNKTIDEAKLIFNNFHKLLTEEDTIEVNMEKLDKLIIFEGVRKYPIRVKCATLAWHTMKAALDLKKKKVYI